MDQSVVWILLQMLSEQLDSISKSCNSNSEIEQVGSISANPDESIGKLIAEAMDRVGQDGVTVEEGQSPKNDLEVVDGMQFDRGYLILTL